MTTGRYDELVKRQRAEFKVRLLTHVRRLNWSKEAILAERQARLRELLAWAVTHSEFYRHRLSTALPFDSFTESDLHELPAMTKSDLMENFDRIVTDSRLSLGTVEDHIDALDSDAYLLDWFRALPTGGTSGQRGVFVYDWEEWITLLCSTTRWRLRRSLDAGVRHRSIGVFADTATHISRAMIDFLAGREADGPTLSAAMPVAEIVERLNELRPSSIDTYPSTLRLLVDQARLGTLCFAPAEVATCGEWLSPALREDVLQQWGIDIYDYWGTTEGVYAFSCGMGNSMHLPDDLVLLEAVDDGGNLVPAGQPADRVLVTNLYNKTLPLIRYEINDAMTVMAEPCSCGSGHSRIGELQGRPSQAFSYPDGTVLTFLTVPFGALERNRDVTDYQVRQTERGADVFVYGRSQPDLDALHRDLVAALLLAGLRDPEVTVHAEPKLTRLDSGKLRRFVPLGEGHVVLP
jgi:phenylacetate-coenzyme A ligase PaaK-like adenylate-forming protein